ncbi:MAG: cache domain-containing protein [Spirochaetota bacterium]
MNYRRKFKRFRLKAIREIVSNSLRIKLVMSLITVVLVVGISSTIIGIKIINDNVIGQAYESVRSDLDAAQFIYDKEIDEINIYIKHVASLPYIQRAITKRNTSLLLGKLKEVKKEAGLDILNIILPDGRMLVRSNNPSSTTPMGIDVLLNKTINTGKGYSGTGIISAKTLQEEGSELAQQARIELVPTSKAHPIHNISLRRGLALKASAPVYINGKIAGILYGAKLLNRDYSIPDNIKNLIFNKQKIDGVEYGTATIFLDNIRVSTNVTLKNGERAIGTCVSEEVYRKVVVQKKIWLDKAFVVNNWYISAYKPIYDITDKVVGILYVGILEEKFNIIKNETTRTYITLIISTLLLSVFLAIWLIKNIITPINHLMQASKSVTEGHYDRKIRFSSKDELGHLCDAFNNMTDAIVKRDRQLKEQTQRKTVQLEKMASLGRLASGIAHEINNPLTGILTYSSMLLEDCENPEHRYDLQVIVDETLRCRKIVKEVLDFARETQLDRQTANINDVINSTISILERHVAFQNITIKKYLAIDIPDTMLDINQFKSVINNLALNAADAMKDGGILTIMTRMDNENNNIVISFNDTGEGIPEDKLNEIFDPFFTTKETGKGTGLGLAVTYGVVDRHNGKISVESKPGEGSTFTIVLPVED